MAADWAIIGQHESGALLVCRAGGNGYPHKCCPRCFVSEGPLTSELVEVPEGEGVLWCVGCGWRAEWQRDPADDGLRLFADVDGSKWHVVGAKAKRFLRAPCKAQARSEAAYTRDWGEVAEEDLCARCAGYIVREYGEGALAGLKGEKVGSGGERNAG